MTWWRGDAGSYGVFFNRDEKKTRAKARPPQVIDCRGIQCISPRDPDAGGTWILCNAFGVTVAVLNAYQADAPQHSNVDLSSLRSRGEIPLLLADVTDVEVGAERIADLRAARYRPFTVTVLDSSSESCWTVDNSGALAALPVPIAQPLLSSSFAPEEVFTARNSAFLEMTSGAFAGDRNALSAFHRSADGRATAFTPKMLRPDAQTFSLTELSIDDDRVRCEYEAYAPEFDGASEVSSCGISRRASD